MRGALLLLAAAAAAGPPASPGLTPAASREESEVRGFLADQVAAWNRGDIDGFVAVYAEDATFVSPSGISRGRAPILERYKKKYPGKEGMGTLTIEFREVRVMEGAAAVAGTWTLTWPGKPRATGSTALTLAPKERGGWEIVQDASM